ncbi:MAG: hypothetical protein NVS4B8_02430 [Herpetosiphon sp.]
MHVVEVVASFVGRKTHALWQQGTFSGKHASERRVVGRSWQHKGSVLAVVVVLIALVVPFWGGNNVKALDNGLARTPPMGWNSWNNFGCKVNEDSIREMADIMAKSGMLAAGYQYVIVDDCWASARDAKGTLYASPKAFPHGIKALADYVHGRGLKFGLYTDAGTATCRGRPGSLNHEQQDAMTFAAWGVDFIKEDYCNAERLDPKTRYTIMRDAIAKTGRPMIFSICDCIGPNDSWDWGPSVGNLWRTTYDIADSWPRMLRNLDSNAEHAAAAGPGGWNDPDMLEIGNGGMTADEYRVQFSLWALMAAPLIAGNNLAIMTQETLDILNNGEVIAIDQDPAGKQGIKIREDGAGRQVWAKQMQAKGEQAVALVNRGDTTANITVNWTDLGMQAGDATVRDLWAHLDRGVSRDSYTAVVAPHGVAMLRVTQAYVAPTPVVPTAVVPTPIVPAAPVPATGHFDFANTEFRELWTRSDALVKQNAVSYSWIWGPEPFTGEVREFYVQSPGSKRTIQYSDKSRMEINQPDAPRGQFYVSNGRLADEMITGLLQAGDAQYDQRAAAEIAVAGDPTNTFPLYKDLQSVYRRSRESSQANEIINRGADGSLEVHPFPDANNDSSMAIVQHVAKLGIPRVFWNYMNQPGSIIENSKVVQATPLFDWRYVIGEPLTEAYWTVAKVGGVDRGILIQAFERRVLTYTPDNPAAYQVEMGNIGRHYFEWRYGARPN